MRKPWRYIRHKVENALSDKEVHVLIELPLPCCAINLKRLGHESNDREHANHAAERDLDYSGGFWPRGPAALHRTKFKVLYLDGGRWDGAREEHTIKAVKLDSNGTCLPVIFCGLPPMPKSTMRIAISRMNKVRVTRRTRRDRWYIAHTRRIITTAVINIHHCHSCKEPYSDSRSAAKTKMMKVHKPTISIILP